MILDRDGVINEDFGYVGKKENFVFIERNLRQIKRLSNTYRPIIITNQSGIARGKYTHNEFVELSKWMIGQLQKIYEIEIYDLYYCPHHPEFPKNDNNAGCNCRKPGTLLFEKAIRDHRINVEHSITVGDNLRDVIPGVLLGFKKNYLISCSSKSSHDGVNIINNLSEII